MTCTAAVKIIIAGYFIQLTRQRGTAVVNGVRLSKFPIIRPGISLNAFVFIINIFKLFLTLNISKLNTELLIQHRK